MATDTFFFLGWSYEIHHQISEAFAQSSEVAFFTFLCFKFLRASLKFGAS